MFFFCHVSLVPAHRYSRVRLASSSEVFFLGVVRTPILVACDMQTKSEGRRTGDGGILWLAYIETYSPFGRLAPNKVAGIRLT